jgi:dUTPase
MEQVKIKLNGGIMPTKGSEYAAAYDVYAPENIELKYGRQVIDLKFQIELPHGYAAIIQPRSGFASKGMAVQAMTRYFLLLVLGFFSREQRVDADVIVGLIDEDYRGNAGVIVKSNFKSFVRRAIIPKGTRIAQMRIVKVPDTELLETESIDMSKNRGGGYGHTGVK